MMNTENEILKNEINGFLENRKRGGVEGLDGEVAVERRGRVRE